MDTLVVLSSDQNYFPLAKGLVLSLKACQLDRDKFGIAFIDLGCSREAVEWLRKQDVEVTVPDSAVMGDFASDENGWLRAQLCRPYLPRIFPGAETLIWMDSDMWVQLPEVLPTLRKLARAQPANLFVCPEWHYSYIDFYSRAERRRDDKLNWHAGAYGTDVGAKMAIRPMFNCGLFAMSAANPFWDLWREELKGAYRHEYPERGDELRHMADQITLNILAYRTGRAVPVDPIFNYLCVWSAPFRNAAGLVCVPLPPYDPIGTIHLAWWKGRSAHYWRQGLLFESGAYLSPAEKDALLRLGAR
jgi:hypothetical protein